MVPLELWAQLEELSVGNLKFLSKDPGLRPEENRLVKHPQTLSTDQVSDLALLDMHSNYSRKLW